MSASTVFSQLDREGSSAQINVVALPIGTTLGRIMVRKTRHGFAFDAYKRQVHLVLPRPLKRVPGQLMGRYAMRKIADLIRGTVDSYVLQVKHISRPARQQ
jgi:hypothetical protein